MLWRMWMRVGCFGVGRGAECVSGGVDGGAVCGGWVAREVAEQGEVPVEGFRLRCAPAAGGTAGGGVCAEERGIFYPGGAVLGVGAVRGGGAAGDGDAAVGGAGGWGGLDGGGVRGSVGLCGFGGDGWLGVVAWGGFVAVGGRQVCRFGCAFAPAFGRAEHPLLARAGCVGGL